MYSRHGLLIVQKLGLKVRPFKQKIAVVEASGNNLDLEGTTKFYIKAPHVLGAETFYPMEAAVLNGSSTDNELLICLDTLIAWNLVPSNFPNVKLGEISSDGYCAPKTVDIIKYYPYDDLK